MDFSIGFTPNKAVDTCLPANNGSHWENQDLHLLHLTRRFDHRPPFSERFSIQGRFFRQSICNGIVLARNVPKADRDLLKSLFSAQRFVQFQEQVEVGGLGVPIRAKMVVLTPKLRDVATMNVRV